MTTMADANIADRVKQIIVEQLGVDAAEVTPNAHFVNDLGADSLDTVELVMALEEEFDTEIPDEQAEKIQTVGQAIRYITAHAKKRALEDPGAPRSLEDVIGYRFKDPRHLKEALSHKSFASESKSGIF